MSKYSFSRVYRQLEPESNKNFIEESEQTDYNDDSLKQYKQLVSTYKTLYADDYIIKNVIRENSVAFLEYYLDNGLDVFARGGDERLYYLKYIIEHNRLDLMRLVIDYHHNTKIKTRKVKHCDELMEYAVIYGRLTFVKMFISIGMRFDAKRLLNLAIQQAAKIHAEVYEPPTSRFNYLDTTTPGYKASRDARFNEAVIKASLVDKHIKTVKVDKKIPYVSKKEIAKLYIFLTTMVEKETTKTLPLELYSCLDEDSVKLYVKAGLIPSDFTQMIKYLKNKEIFVILIPHTSMEYNRLYIRFINHVNTRLDYLTSILTRTDASRIIHECCELLQHLQQLGEESMELLEFYYKHAPTLVYRIVKPTTALVKWASNKKLNMYHIITKPYTSSHICVFSRFDEGKIIVSNETIDQIVEYNLLTDNVALFDYTQNIYGNLPRYGFAMSKFKDVFQSELPITYYKNSLCVLAIQSCIANNYYDHLEYFIQFIPNGMTNENARYFLPKNEEIPDSLKSYVDAACLTKPACSK